MGTAVVSPFVKTQFASYRDWEDALVSFLFREARQPDESLWIAAAGSRTDVAFCALLLSNVLSTRKGYTKAADAAYQAFLQLTDKRAGAEEYEQWLQSGWLNVSRVANALSMQLGRVPLDHNEQH